MIRVTSDGEYLAFDRDGHEFYDVLVPAPADLGRFIRHMDDKMWFPEVRKQTIELIRAVHDE